MLSVYLFFLLYVIRVLNQTLICSNSCIGVANVVGQDAIWREGGRERVMNDPSEREGEGKRWAVGQLG